MCLLDRNTTSLGRLCVPKTDLRIRLWRRWRPARLSDL